MKNLTILKIITAAILIVITSCQSSVDNLINDIEEKLVQEELRKYDSISIYGTALDRYEQAVSVSVTYQGAGDSANYKKWQKIVKDDAFAAGIPQD